MSTQETLRVRVHQCDVALADVPANRARIESAAQDAGDLVVFPELALTGYHVGGGANEMAHRLDEGHPVAAPQDGPAIVYGLVERGEDHLVYNTGVVARGDRVLARHRKIYLPTYGMFDEGRLFAPGREGVHTFTVSPGWRCSLLVCEDLWHPALAYLAAIQEADLLIVIAAAGGRNAAGPAESVTTPGSEDRFFSSNAPWELLARTTAFVHGMYVVVANRVGSEGGVTFSGGSLVVAPDGEVVARGAETEEDTLDVVLEGDRVRRARHPFSHLRDDDPGLVVREIGRILGLGAPSMGNDTVS